MPTPARSPLGHLLDRRAAGPVTEALGDTRVVLVNGARQCGKSTLVAQIARERGTAWFSLDRSETLQAAQCESVSSGTSSGLADNVAVMPATSGK